MNPLFLKLCARRRRVANLKPRELHTEKNHRQLLRRRAGVDILKKEKKKLASNRTRSLYWSGSTVPVCTQTKPVSTEKLALEQTMQAQRGSRSIALFFLQPRR